MRKCSWNLQNSTSNCWLFENHLHGNDAADRFAHQLLQLGDGKITTAGSKDIQLPFGKFLKSERELFTSVFPDLERNYWDPAWLSERAILAPKNDPVN